MKSFSGILILVLGLLLSTISLSWSNSDGYTYVVKGQGKGKQYDLQFNWDLSSSLSYKTDIEMEIDMKSLGKTSFLLSLTIVFSKIRTLPDRTTLLKIEFKNPSGTLSMFNNAIPIPGLERLQAGYIQVSATPKGQFGDLQLSEELEALMHQKELSIAKQFLKFFISFPKEPMGIGGSWEIKYDLPLRMVSGGLDTHTRQVCTFTNVEKSPQSSTLAYFSIQGQIQSEGAGPSATTHGSGKIEGSITFDQGNGWFESCQLRRMLQVVVEKDQATQVNQNIQIKRIHE